MGLMGLCTSYIFMRPFSVVDIFPRIVFINDGGPAVDYMSHGFLIC
jgi:hypothetical protein